ncbi:MFS transporter [Streptomyces lavendulae]|uniref:MFS transporter n=1 Tax=Streptomyces lavendulae TaxID=1914 RepID=UPI00371D22ED
MRHQACSGTSLTAAGLVSAAFGLATIPSRPAGGHLADRIGRRPAIVLGLCGYAVAQPAIAASASLATGAMGAGLLAAVLGRWDLRRLFVTDAATYLAAQC